MTTIDVLGIVKDFLDSNSDVSRLALADVFEEAGDEKQAERLREGVNYYALTSDDQTIAENYDGEMDTWITELKFTNRREAQTYIDGAESSDWGDTTIFSSREEARKYILELLELDTNGEDWTGDNEGGDDDGPS